MGRVAVVVMALVERWFSLVLQECWQLKTQQRWRHKSHQWMPHCLKLSTLMLRYLVHHGFVT